jgi:DICT domain-containing protein
VYEAFIEVMTSDHDGVRLALTQNTYMFQEAVRNKKEVAELKADIEIIKKRLLSTQETDFKTQGAKRGKHRAGGG